MHKTNWPAVVAPPAGHIAVAAYAADQDTCTLQALHSRDTTGADVLHIRVIASSRRECTPSEIHMAAKAAGLDIRRGSYQQANGWTKLVICAYPMDDFKDGWASGSMQCKKCKKVFTGVRFRYSCHDKVEGEWPTCCGHLAAFLTDWRPDGT